MSAVRSHLPDDAWVVRGGLNSPDRLAQSIERAIERMGAPGLSAWAANVATPRELIDAAEVPHTWICLSTVGRLEEAGFILEQTGDIPHHTIWFPGDWEGWIDKFCAAFDAPALKRGFM